MMAKPDLRPCRTSQARYSPTARIGERLFARPSRPRAAVCASLRPACRVDEVETLARLEAWNRPIHRIRGRIEKIFGTWKRSYGLRRMRWRGLAKAGLQIRFTAVAYNIKRCSRILAAA